VRDYLQKRASRFIFYQGEREDRFPEKSTNGSQDILVSYLSPWIIPNTVLKKARLWNINLPKGEHSFILGFCSF